MAARDEIADREHEADNTSADEREAIRDCVWWLEAGIVALYEVPQPTEHSADLLYEKLQELTQDGAPYVLLIDLRRAGQPNARVREKLRRLFEGESLRFVAVATGRNAFLTTAARLVIGLVARCDSQVLGSYEEALAKARAAAATL